MKKQKKLTSYLKQVFILTIIFLSFNKIKAPITCTSYVSRNTGLRYVTKPLQNIKEEINIKNFNKNINQFVKKGNKKNNNHKKFFLEVLKKLSPQHEEKLKQSTFKKSNKEKTPKFTIKENEYMKKITLNKLNKFRTTKKKVLNEGKFFEENNEIKKLKKELTLSPTKCFYDANFVLKNLSEKEKKLMKIEKVLNKKFLNEEIIKKCTNKLNKKPNLIASLNFAKLNSFKK